MNARETTWSKKWARKAAKVRAARIQHAETLHAIRVANFKLQRERLTKIVMLRQSGKTLAEIGEVFGVTRQRIEQILNKRPPAVSPPTP